MVSDECSCSSFVVTLVCLRFCAHLRAEWKCRNRRTRVACPSESTFLHPGAVINQVSQTKPLAESSQELVAAAAPQLQLGSLVSRPVPTNPQHWQNPCSVSTQWSLDGVLTMLRLFLAWSSQSSPEWSSDHSNVSPKKMFVFHIPTTNGGSLALRSIAFRIFCCELL